MVNGMVLLDEVVPFFRNSYKIRPTSLQGKKCLREVILYKKYPLYLGKLTLGKGRRAGFWYQNQGEITNFLLFLPVTVQQAVQMTTRSQQCQLLLTLSKKKKYVSCNSMSFNVISKYK